MKNIGKSVHLRNLVNDNFHFEMLAIDQRPPIFNIIENTKGGKASYKDIAEFKGFLTKFLSNRRAQRGNLFNVSILFLNQFL